MNEILSENMDKEIVIGTHKFAKQVRNRGVEEILNDMQLLVGPPELRYIQNVAIMMFCEHPEKFFGYTYVQMTSFPKGSVENPNVL